MGGRVLLMVRVVGGGERVLVAVVTMVTIGVPVAATFIYIKFGDSEQEVKLCGKDANP